MIVPEDGNSGRSGGTLAAVEGLLDALNARLPPALEPLASWTRTGKVKLPDGDVRCQHWWSARLTQVKAA